MSSFLSPSSCQSILVFMVSMRQKEGNLLERTSQVDVIEFIFTFLRNLEICLPEIEAKREKTREN